MKINHYYSNEWCKDEHARTQEELQEIAKQIRSNCKCESIENMDGYVCTIYKNDNLGLKFWIKDTFGKISEIDEGRAY